MLVDRAAVLGNDLVVPPEGALDDAAGVLGVARVGELGEAAPAFLPSTVGRIVGVALLITLVDETQHMIDTLCFGCEGRPVRQLFAESAIFYGSIGSSAKSVYKFVYKSLGC